MHKDNFPTARDVAAIPVHVIFDEFLPDVEDEIINARKRGSSDVLYINTRMNPAQITALRNYLHSKDYSTTDPNNPSTHGFYISGW